MLEKRVVFWILSFLCLATFSRYPWVEGYIEPILTFGVPSGFWVKSCAFLWLPNKTHMVCLLLVLGSFSAMSLCSTPFNLNIFNTLVWSFLKNFPCCPLFPSCPMSPSITSSLPFARRSVLSHIATHSSACGVFFPLGCLSFILSLVDASS